MLGGSTGWAPELARGTITNIITHESSEGGVILTQSIAAGSSRALGTTVNLGVGQFEVDHR